MQKKPPTDIAFRYFRAVIGACIGGYFGWFAAHVIIGTFAPTGVWTHGPPTDPLFWSKLVVYVMCTKSGAFVGMALACWRDLPQEDVPS